MAYNNNFVTNLYIAYYTTRDSVKIEVKSKRLKEVKERGTDGKKTHLKNVQTPADGSC